MLGQIAAKLFENEIGRRIVLPRPAAWEETRRQAQEGSALADTHAGPLFGALKGTRLFCFREVAAA